MIFVTVCVKLLLVLAIALLPVVPLAVEYLNFKKDKENRISQQAFKAYPVFFALCFCSDDIFSHSAADHRMDSIAWLCSVVCIQAFCQ